MRQEIFSKTVKLLPIRAFTDPYSPASAESVSYRVWNPNDKNEYLVSGTMQLELGSVSGNPELMELDAVTVSDKPLEVFKLTSIPDDSDFTTLPVLISFVLPASLCLPSHRICQKTTRKLSKPSSGTSPQFFGLLSPL